MVIDTGRVVRELPLPLGPDADVLDALRIAVAVEDACGVVIPDELITTADLGSAGSIESLLRRPGQAP